MIYHDYLLTIISTDTNYLVSIPIFSKKGIIERNGDIFFGIQNNTTCSILVEIWQQDQFIVIMKIPPKEIRYLDSPFNLINLKQQLSYKIIITNEKFEVLYGDIEFIYGYVTKALRQKLRYLYCKL